MKKRKPEQITDRRQETKYEPPRVVSISKQEILAELGPARACTSWFGGVAGFCDNDTYPPTD
jgi:hypothetical protein